MLVGRSVCHNFLKRKEKLHFHAPIGSLSFEEAGFLAHLLFYFNVGCFIYISTSSNNLSCLIYNRYTIQYEHLVHIHLLTSLCSTQLKHYNSFSFYFFALTPLLFFSRFTSYNVCKSTCLRIPTM